MTPRISVVIPTCRRSQLLARCLTALCEQTLDGRAYEIVVVSDGPDPETERVVLKLAQGTRVALRYVALDQHRGPAAARNHGWRVARATLIAFTDDDTIPAHDWLENGIAAFEDEVAAVWGRTIVPLPDDPTDYESDAAKLSHAGFVTANCFCRRTALMLVGGFDERFTRAWREDSDLLFSLLSCGLKVIHARSAKVLHPVRPARWGVSLLQQRKAAFNALLYKKHRRLYRTYVQATPPWQYYAIVCAIAVGVIGLSYAPTLATLALAAWLVLTADFCWQRLAHTSRAAAHVIEMIVTSVLIPPLAVYWRLYGALKYRVFFL